MKASMAAREADGWQEQQRDGVSACVSVGCVRRHGDGAGGGGSGAGRALEGDDARRRRVGGVRSWTRRSSHVMTDEPGRSGCWARGDPAK